MTPKVVTQLDEARLRQAEAVEKMEEWDGRIQALPEDATAEEAEFFEKAFESARAEAKRWDAQVERLEAMAAARRMITLAGGDNDTNTLEHADDGDGDGEKRHARPRGSTVEPKTYTRQTSSQGRSFFADLVNGLKGDGDARTRLERHTNEVAYEKRAISTTVTAGGNFVPPEYLGELYAQFPRAGRPFADAIPNKMVHEAGTGMNITIPRITTGTTQSVIITENSTTVSSTDIVEALYTIPVRTIAGQQDISQQLLDHSQPGIDQVIFTDLRSAYDTQLDTQLLNGTGANGQHLGVRAVTSPNTVSFTTGGSTAANHVPVLYNAIQLVATNRFEPADLIVWHPRRGAFLASNLSSTFPLFQLGNLYQAAGTQNNGFVGNFAGMNVCQDANVRTTDGGTTNQDEIYVLRSQDLILWEGELQARVMSEVLSNTLTVRLQLFAYSAFASGRYPKGITIVSGLGLAAPTFT